MELTIRNGTLVTATDTYRADIGIADTKIVAIAEHLPAGNHDIDADGRWVVPGFLDVHTHFDAYLGPFEMQSPDDFTSGTRQAACGGVTTIVDFAFQSPGKSLHDAVKEWSRKADGRCYVDYGFHTVITDLRPDVLDEITEMVHDGYPSFKVFMVHGYGDLSDRQLFQILKRVGEAKGVLAVHAESGDVVQALSDELVAQQRVLPCEIPHASPPDAEAEAAARVITLSRLAGNVPLYVVHLSSADGLAVIRAARAAGQRVYAETRPTYLVLDESYYQRSAAEAVRYMISPPLRPAAHQDALWTGLRNGDVQTVASDHTAWNFRGQKELGVDDFTRTPPGVPGVETLGPLLLTAGVQAGRMSVNRWVEVLATNPAKLFGLYPQKGSIAVGSDADLVIYDPAKRVTLSKDVLHGATDYEPYEGVSVCGYPVLTMSRGTIVMEDGQMTVPPGRGQWLHRSAFTFV